MGPPENYIHFEEILGKLQWILCGNPASREHLVGRKILITIISHESNEYQER